MNDFRAQFTNIITIFSDKNNINNNKHHYLYNIFLRSKRLFPLYITANNCQTFTPKQQDSAPNNSE